MHDLSAVAPAVECITRTSRSQHFLDLMLLPFLLRASGYGPGVFVETDSRMARSVSRFACTSQANKKRVHDLARLRLARQRDQTEFESNIMPRWLVQQQSINMIRVQRSR